jgi:hypothetical protein
VKLDVVCLDKGLRSMYLAVEQRPQFVQADKLPAKLDDSSCVELSHLWMATGNVMDGPGHDAHNENLGRAARNVAWEAAIITLQFDPRVGTVRVSVGDAAPQMLFCGLQPQQPCRLLFSPMQCHIRVLSVRSRPCIAPDGIPQLLFGVAGWLAAEGGDGRADPRKAGLALLHLLSSTASYYSPVAVESGEHLMPLQSPSLGGPNTGSLMHCPARSPLHLSAVLSLTSQLVTCCLSSSPR